MLLHHCCYVITVKENIKKFFCWIKINHSRFESKKQEIPGAGLIRPVRALEIQAWNGGRALVFKQAWRFDEETSYGKERRDEKHIGREIRRTKGRAAGCRCLGEDGAPATACSLVSVPKRRSMAAHLWMGLCGGSLTSQVDPIHPLGQQSSALNGLFLIWDRSGGLLAGQRPNGSTRPILILKLAAWTVSNL